MISMNQLFKYYKLIKIWKVAEAGRIGYQQRQIIVIYTVITDEERPRFYSTRSKL